MPSLIREKDYTQRLPPTSIWVSCGDNARCTQLIGAHMHCGCTVAHWPGSQPSTGQPSGLLQVALWHPTHKIIYSQLSHPPKQDSSKDTHHLSIVINTTLLWYLLFIYIVIIIYSQRLPKNDTMIFMVALIWCPLNDLVCTLFVKSLFFHCKCNFNTFWKFLVQIRSIIIHGYDFIICIWFTKVVATVGSPFAIQ